MHARELVELAALASMHGTAVMDHQAPLPKLSLERYWTGSKCRLDRWGRSLKQLSEGTAAKSDGDFSEQLGVLEEIVTGDVLARVWAAVVTGHDRRTDEDAGAVARTILVGQQEARNRALSLLVNGPFIEEEEAVRLNRLRRKAECWSDLLVGFLSTATDLTEFAADPIRAGDFAEDFREEGARAWTLLFASMRTSFVAAFEFPSPNADLNGEIAAGVISCFQPEVFDSTGLLRSLWLSRLQHTTNETQCMIEALFVDGADRAAAPHTGEARDREFLARRFPSG